MKKKSDSNDYYVEIPDPSDEVEIILPSELNKERKKRKRVNSKSLNLKWPLIIFFVIVVYLFYEPLLGMIMDFLKSNPTIYSYYLHFESEIANNTIRGVFYVAIFGSLFFLALPSEALFIYFLDSTTYPTFIILLLMVLGNSFGLIINYLFGRILGEKVVEKLFSKSFEKYKERIDKYGGVVLLLGNILPGPIELLTVFYGSFKFRFSTYFYLCFMGRLVKYLILLFLFSFYWDSISLFYSDLLIEFRNLGEIYGSVVKN